MNPETPDFKRLFMAVFLMTALLMGYNVLFGPKTIPRAEPTGGTPTAVEPKAQAAAPAPGVSAPKKEIFSSPIVTKQFRLENGYEAIFSTEGAQVQDFQLSGYQAPVYLTPYLVVESRDSNLTLSAQTRYEILSQDTQSIVFSKVTPENIRVIRRYHFSKTPFVLSHEVEFVNQSNHAQALAVNLLMETHEAGKADEELLAANFRVGDLYKRFPLKDIESNSETMNGSPTYVGFDRRYFFMSLAPEKTGESESATAMFLKVGEHKGMRLNLRQKPFILQPGATQKFAFSSYLGPKELKLLTAAGYGLAENIDYGWFGVLSRPLLWLLTYINQWVLNFGLAIIILTIFIKLLTFPLTQKSFMAQQQMKKIGPQLKEIQKKYAHDKAMLGQQQMAFYKEQGINPMAGCLPILIQMPVWFALYQMLGNSVELYEQPFYGWIVDLTRPDPYYVMPMMMGISMLISQWIMPPAIDESQPQMKYVMWFMPIFLTFVMLSLPAGLSIYMLVNNLLTIAQQVYIKQRYEA